MRAAAVSAALALAAAWPAHAGPELDRIHAAVRKAGVESFVRQFAEVLAKNTPQQVSQHAEMSGAAAFDRTLVLTMRYITFVGGRDDLDEAAGAQAKEVVDGFICTTPVPYTLVERNGVSFVVNIVSRDFRPLLSVEVPPRGCAGFDPPA